MGNFLWSERGRYGARREAALRTAERLGAKDYPTLFQDVSGIALDKLAEAAEETLRRTEDAYRDVLGYVLRKLEPTLRPLPSAARRGGTISRPRCRRRGWTSSSGART